MSAERNALGTNATADGTVRPGWLYEGPAKTEQNQGCYVPVLDDDGNVWLVDTYVISPVGSRGQGQVEAMTRRIVELGTTPSGWVLSHAHATYYHARSCLVACPDARLPEGFEALCHLPDWEYVSDRESEDYGQGDVCGPVQLCHEHGYRWNSCRHGVMLRRKGAQKSRERELEALMADATRQSSTPHCNSWAKRQTETLHDEEKGGFPPDLEARYQDFLERMSVLERMEREYHELLETQARYQDFLERTSALERMEREYHEFLETQARDEGDET